MLKLFIILPQDVIDLSMQVVQESLEEMLKAEVDLAMKDEIPTVSPPLIENIVDMMDHPMCGLEIDYFYS
jgi:hypothetical protein